MELRFAVVEDRLPDAQRLESLLRLAFGGGQPLVCDHYESGDAFLAAFPSKNYQVVFLDICMEGTNGIETARILRRTDPDLLLVFVTSSPEYVWDAFPVHPFDYLLKPYREEKLFQLADGCSSGPNRSWKSASHGNKYISPCGRYSTPWPRTTTSASSATTVSVGPSPPSPKWSSCCGRRRTSSSATGASS